MEVINFNKFVKLIGKKKELNELEVNKRKLLEECSSKNVGVNLFSIVSNYNSNVFIQVYQELVKEEEEEMLSLQDMVLGENLIFNINTCESYLDMEDEIY